MTFENRFIVEPHVVEAHLQNQIGRGMNLVGYYMFHGGTQIPGLKEPGYPESYDFQSPITEFGLIRPSYKYLKILHHFVNDFCQDFVETRVVEPNNPIRDEKNTKALRYIARAKDNSGYLFFGNTQVRVPMPDKKAKFKIQLENETLEFSRKEFLLKGQTTAILPFNLTINSVLHKYATAQPLSRLTNGNQEMLFLMQQKDVPVELAFDVSTFKSFEAKGWEKDIENGICYLTKNKNFKNPISIVDKNGKVITIQILTRNQAENSWRVNIQGKESLIITNEDLMVFEDKIELRQINNTKFSLDIYPYPEKEFMLYDENLKIKERGVFMNYSVFIKSIDPNIEINKINSNKAVVKIPNTLPKYCSDFIVNLNYLGGSANAKIDNQIVTDNLFNGTTWDIGLKRFIDKNKNKELVFTVQEWSNKITGVSSDLVEEVKRRGTKTEKISIHPQYSINISTN